MVPEEALPGLEEVRARSIGLSDFGEREAIVWTIFSHLLQTASASSCWQLLSGESAPWPSALIFGGEALGDQAEYAREQLLEKTKDWAPDVLLEQWPGSLTIVMARTVKSYRDVKDAHLWRPLFHETEAFDDHGTAQMSGRIELARAWRLGFDLAQRRSFTLIDLRLLPENVAQQASTDLFRSSLRLRDDRRYVQLTWRALLAELPQPWPEYLVRFVAAHRLR
jgi:hypothetical protein